MKRIIIACDGTGQSAHHGDYKIPSNVARFCNALSNSSSTKPQQIVFYQSGVGSQDLGLGLGNLFQRATGEGFEDNLADTYAFMMNNYQPGDQLFIFGFSRGAFTARVLANIIARLGVISKKTSWALRDTLKAYKDGPQAFEAHNKKMKDEDANWVHKVDIEVVGCWDTVASLGIPLNPRSNPGGVFGEYKNFNGSLVKGNTHSYSSFFFQDLTTLVKVSSVLSMPWPWTSVEVRSHQCCGTCQRKTKSMMIIRVPQSRWFFSPFLILTCFSSHRP